MPIETEVPVCPFMSIATIKAPAEPQRLSIVGGAAPVPEEIKPVACVGPMCGIFVPNIDASGKLTGGVCGLRLGPAVLSAMKTSLDQVVRAIHEVTEAIELASPGGAKN